MHYLIFVATFAILPLITAELGAQDWRQIAAANTPGSLTNSLGIISVSGATIPGGPIVLYGGVSVMPSQLLTDTITFDGDWAIETVSKPASLDTLFSHVMAFCTASGRALLYGGATRFTTLSKRTFDYEHATRTWREVEAGLSPGVTSPSAVIGCSVSHTATGVLLYGGDNGFGTAPGETWWWNGSAWSRLTTATNPPAHGYAFMTYDSNRDVVIMFGGTTSIAGEHDDTWEFDGSDWTPVATANTPPARFGQGSAMTFDEPRGRCVLRAGFTVGGTMFNDTWEYDGTDWYEVTTASSPPAGSAQSLAYHSPSARCIGFGVAANSPGGPTWTYGGTGAIFETFGAGCAGTAGTPRLRSLGGSIPSLGSAFEASLSNAPVGITLFVASPTFTTTTPLQVIGMPPGCIGYLDTTAITAVRAGDPAILSLPVPSTASLAGAEFYLQGFPLAITGTPLELIASNGGHGIIY